MVPRIYHLHGSMIFLVVKTWSAKATWHLIETLSDRRSKE